MATFIGQNFQYDYSWLFENLGIRTKGYAHDTRLLHHALYPELPKDLDSLAKLYTDYAAAWKVLNQSEKGDA